ncbi:hypothetical protein GCM10020221_25050 [Streptomyces thioluteus]|uniref:Secreted protein n=1 Tax=Streptomyces thioluteus TaxID=66431 RepID=A0ABN3WWY6_STRTU
MTLSQLLDRLPCASAARAFVLTQLLGPAYAEPRWCGLPVGTVRSRVARARVSRAIWPVETALSGRPWHGCRATPALSSRAGSLLSCFLFSPSLRPFLYPRAPRSRGGRRLPRQLTAHEHCGQAHSRPA